MQKNIIYLFLLLFTSPIFAQYENYIVLSDLDDTYKITNTKCKPVTVYNALCTKKSFVGMTTLYKHISSSAYRFYVLSSSPNSIRNKVDKLLEKTGLMPDSVILKPSGMKGPVYKYVSIRKIILDNPGKKFIFLGDDSGHDHKIYARLYTEYPEQVAAIYIRPVKYKKKNTFIKTFYSAFDIAYFECLENRISTEFANSIAGEIKTSKNTKFLLPGYLTIRPEIAKDTVVDESDLYRQKKEIIEYLMTL